MIDTLSHHAGLIGLLFFFSFFSAVLIYVLRPGVREHFRQCGNIPLKDGSDE